MEEQRFLDDFNSLPEEARREVVDFIAFLRQRYADDRVQSKPQEKSISEEKFIGMWRNRKDLEDRFNHTASVTHGVDGIVFLVQKLFVHRTCLS